MIRNEEKYVLKTEETEIQGRPFLRLSGRLDIQTAPRLSAAVNGLLRDGAEVINLDLSELEFMDSTGIGALVKINESLRARGKHFSLQWAPPQILEILHLAKLDRVLDIVPDRRKVPRSEITLTQEPLLGNLHPCWELFGCELHECAFFGGQHYTCWTLPNAPCKAVQSDDLLEEIASCTRCVVFQNNVQFLGEIHSNYTNYISEAEQAFRRIRDRAVSLEQAVTARTKELADSEARYRDLFEEANSTLFDLEGPQALIRSMNLEFERMTGLAREVWIGQSFFELASPEDKAMTAASYRHVLDGQKCSFELHLEIAPGQQRVVWCNLRPLPGTGRTTRIRGSWSDITELVRVREEHSRLYHAIQEISDYVIIVDEQSRVLFVNDAFRRAWGYEQDSDLIGRKSDEIELGFPHGYWERLRREVTRKGVWQGEAVARRRDGAEFPIELYASPIFDEAGHARMLVGVSRDISVRKQMETMLRESRQKYAKLIECAADAMIVFGEDRRIEQANRQACEFFGLSLGEITQRRLEDLWNGMNARALAEHLKHLRESGRFLAQASFRHVSGGALEAEINATDLGDGLFLGIIRDMSERRRIEQENHIVQERFEALFRSIIDGVMLVDERGLIAMYNKQFREVLSLKPQDLDGLSVQSFYEAIAERTEDAHDFRRWVHSISIEPNSVARRELVLQKPEKRIIRIYTGPMRSDRNSIVGRVWMLRDITDQRRLEEQLVQSQKMESIGTLAGGIAHDFNNLLTSILGYSSIMLRTLPPSHPHYRPVRNIDSSAQRAAELTQGLLAFSRRRETKMRSLRLNDVVRDTMRLLGHMIPKQIEMVTEFASSLPAIRGDAMQLEQVIMNLCVNARDAMKDGGTLSLRTGVVDLTGRALPVGVENHPGRFVVLSVQDTGCGISDEVRERIFEPFFTTKAQGEGTGLGLALAYGIVRSHGGFIDLVSAPGQGSRFDLYFPPTVAEMDLRGKGTAVAEGASPAGQGECILLVDDEPVVREVAESVLQQLGYRVIAAEGGPEAIQIYEEQSRQIDLVLLDLMMPRMRGEKVFAHLREMNPNVRIIISTGNPEMIDRFPELQQYASGFANKPYRMNDLSKAIHAALLKR